MFDLPVVRLFADQAQAGRAETALRRWGFEPERIRVVVGTEFAGLQEVASGSATDPVVRAIEACGIPRSDVARYAGPVRRGNILLSVHAPFGTGGIAEELMDQCDPVQGDFVERYEQLLPSENAAPFSATLGLPALSRRGRTTSEALGIPTLANPDRFVFGQPSVGDSPAPFSRLFGLPTISRRGRTAGEALHLPELKRQDRFALGEPSVEDSAAPFSRLFGLPVLVREPETRVEGSVLHHHQGYVDRDRTSGRQPARVPAIGDAGVGSEIAASRASGSTGLVR